MTPFFQFSLLTGLALLAAWPAGMPSTPPGGPRPISLGGDSLRSIQSLGPRQHAFRSGHWEKAATELEQLLASNIMRAIRASTKPISCWRNVTSARRTTSARPGNSAGVSDETPNSPLAPLALERAGDVYADLWRRPELDPTYGQTALATYREC